MHTLLVVVSKNRSVSYYAKAEVVSSETGWRGFRWSGWLLEVGGMQLAPNKFKCQMAKRPATV